MKTNKPLSMVKHFLERQGFVCKDEPICVKYHVAIAVVLVLYYLASICCVAKQSIMGLNIRILFIIGLNGLCLVRVILKNFMKQRIIRNVYSHVIPGEYYKVRHPYSFRAGTQVVFLVTSACSLILNNGNASGRFIKGIICLTIAVVLMDELIDTMESMFQASANYKENKE